MKSIGVVILSVVLIIGLLQIDAIGHLNPIFHSIALSFRRMVNWVRDAHSPKTEQVILTGEQGFLNAEHSEENPSPSVEEPLAPQRNAVEVELEKPAETANSTGNFPKEEIGEAPPQKPAEKPDSRTLQLLQEVVDREDPVTELFPETEWYDELDLQDYDVADLLTIDTEEEAPLDESLNSDAVQPLLDEIQSQIPQQPESDAFEAIPEP